MPARYELVHILKFMLISDFKFWLDELDITNSDVVTWKRLPRYRCLWGESTGDQWFSPTKVSNAGFDVFFYVSLNKLMNKQQTCRRYPKPWRPCDVTVMKKYALGFCCIRAIQCLCLQCCYVWVVCKQGWRVLNGTWFLPVNTVWEKQILENPKFEKTGKTQLRSCLSNLVQQ